MTTWEEIRDEVAGMLADGKPLEDVISKLGKTKNDMKKPMTNEEWLRSATTEQLAEWIASVVQKAISIKENNGIVMLESAIWWDEWLKQPHTPKE